jgi:hypothetical protein
MKKAAVTMVYELAGTVIVEVPDDFTIEQAIKYAQKHIKDLPLPSDPSYIEDSEVIDDEGNAEFLS